jgi:hypothetical protein
MPSYPTDAACAHSHLPPSTWDDEVAGETDQQKERRIATAQAVCGTCPVADLCHARRYEGGGVRAGKPHPDRVPGYTGDIYAGIVTARQPVTCGSNGGYQRHVKFGEKACDDCKAAHSVYVSERLRAKKAARAAAA